MKIFSVLHGGVGRASLVSPSHKSHSSIGMSYILQKFELNDYSAK